VPIATGSDFLRTPAVAWLGAKYAIAWVQMGSPFLTGTIQLRTFEPRTCLPCGLQHTLSGPNAAHADPKLASRISGGVDEAMLVFASVVPVPPFHSAVAAQRLEAIGAGGAVVDLGGGCGAGGTAGTNGVPLAIGASAFAFQLGGALGGGNGGALFVLGAAGPPLVCGACAVLAPTVSFPRAVTGGSASFPLPIPCDVNLVGGALEVQWWCVGASSTPCAPAPAVAFSPRLSCTVGL
jgi:hypothetical protein